VLVEYQAPGLRVTHRFDPEEIGQLALEPARRERGPGQRRHLGVRTVEVNVELDAGIGWPRSEEIDNAHGRTVVMTRDQSETQSVREERAGHLDQVGGGHRPGHPVMAYRVEFH
jgi:hypothetical protein